MNLKKIFSKNLILSFVPLATLAFLITHTNKVLANSGPSLMQVAPVKSPGEYEIKLQTDIIFNQGGGLNITPHFVTGIVEHLFDVDAYFGTGKTGFQIGALGKYNLLPDLPNQMGLSFLGGFTYLKETINKESFSGGLVTLGILSSKQIETQFGSATPYAGFQSEFLIRSKNSAFLMNLQLGSYWQITQTAPWSFYTEFGISLRKSFFMLALGASYPF